MVKESGNGGRTVNSEIISHRIRCKIAFEIRIGLGFNQSFVSAFGRRLLHVFSVSFPSPRILNTCPSHQERIVESWIT